MPHGAALRAVRGPLRNEGGEGESIAEREHHGQQERGDEELGNEVDLCKGRRHAQELSRQQLSGIFT